MKFYERIGRDLEKGITPKRRKWRSSTTDSAIATYFDIPWMPVR